MAVNSSHIEERPFASHYIVSYIKDERERGEARLQATGEYAMVIVVIRGYLGWWSKCTNRCIYGQWQCESTSHCVPNISLDPGDEILESATGTGIWLLDLAREVHPSVSLTGIDISQRLFPTQHPQNVTFAVHSVTDLPESWSNKFKLINQRLLCGALTPEQWGTVLEELYRVLKPGGWIQLLETGPEATISGGPMRPYMDALTTASINKGLALDLNRTLGRRLKDAGFVSIQEQTTALPRLDSQDLDFEFKGQKRLFHCIYTSTETSFPCHRDV
ncbi:S-adenosyl-L-methionine-dependent methyltransferase [Rhodocollybia butyracea]|uniref:S-adenosyl-L-methionine-dependent methyltransferase n=1 Tax=Rhodocollybia butyracea TaxID=206335 RepID=A0A9P5PPZ8_9AGAR|nr:S-adenosyl-L-methionine-dependent methyltransferase [Rhodocollybia butyracea]